MLSFGVEVWGLGVALVFPSAKLQLTPDDFENMEMQTYNLSKSCVSKKT